MMRKLLIFPIIFLLLVSIVSADKTVKTISYYGGFVAEAIANVPYSKSFIFKSPDGVEKLYFARATFFVDNINSVLARFYVQLNAEWCVPNYYDIPPNEKRYRMDFDCTDVFVGEGQYEGGFQSTKLLGNVYGEWAITYKNNPSSSIVSIGGTEYSTGETTRIVLQILDSGGNPLSDEVCFTTVRDSGDVVRVDNRTLTYINGSNGLYFYQFSVSLPMGVYSVDSYCDFNGLKVYSADTFHVAKWTEDIQNIYNISMSAFISFVGGTEYSVDETVNIRVQYLRSGTDGGTPVDSQCCNFNLFAPNLTQIFSEELMGYISGSRGLYYYDWVSPSKGLGVYSIDVKCYKCSSPSSWRAYSGSTFHVSGWASNVSGIGELIGLVNESIFNKLYLIQDDLVYINDTLNEVNETVHNITLGNVTVGVDLSKLEKMIISVNDTLKEHNTSVWNKLYMIQDDLYAISLDLENITVLVAGHNETVMNKLYSVQDDLNGIETLISNHNLSVMNELSSIGSDLLYVTNVLISHNSTVMWKLYMIQDEIANVNMTLINATLNITLPTEMDVTNVSVNIIGEDIILKMLEHARILNKRVVNFRNDEYCVENTSILRHNITYEYCIGGNCRMLSDIMDEVCPTGCNFEENKCNPSPLSRAVIGVGAILVLAFIVMMVWRIW